MQAHVTDDAVLAALVYGGEELFFIDYRSAGDNYAGK